MGGALKPALPSAKPKSVGLLIAAGIISAPAFADAPAKLTLITEDYPPLNYLAGKILTGPAVDIVAELQKRLKLSATINVYPWARGFKFLRTNKNTLLFSVTRSKEREGQFKWVGPLAEKKIGMFAKRSANIALKKPEDARPYLIGVQLGGVGLDYLKRWGLTNFDPSSKPETNLKKLLAGRNQLWFSSNATVAANSKKLGLDPSQFELVLTVGNTFMYIAFNKQTSDRIIARWQKTYNQMRQDGTVAKIYRRHGLDDLNPSSR